MGVLFDTSVAVALRDGNEAVECRSLQLSGVALLSIVSVVELEGGMGTAPYKEHRRAALDMLYESLDVLPFGRAEAAVYSRIVAALGFSRSQVRDRMIAAQAIAAGAKLATLNPRDFKRIPDLHMEDWAEPFEAGQALSPDRLR